MHCPRCQSVVSDLIRFHGQDVCRHCAAEAIQWEDDKTWRDSPDGIAYYENEERELRKIRDEINARFVGGDTAGEIDAIEADGRCAPPHLYRRLKEEGN